MKKLFKKIIFITLTVALVAPAHAHIATVVSGLYKDLSAAFKRQSTPPRKWENLFGAVSPQHQTVVTVDEKINEQKNIEKPKEKTTEKIDRPLKPLTETDKFRPWENDGAKLTERACAYFLNVWNHGPNLNFIRLAYWHLMAPEKYIAATFHAYSEQIAKCYSTHTTKNLHAIRSRSFLEIVTPMQYFKPAKARVYKNFEKSASTPELVCMYGTLPMSHKILVDLQKNNITQARVDEVHTKYWQRCLKGNKANQFAKDFKKAQREDAFVAQVEDQDSVRFFLDRMHGWL